MTETMTDSRPGFFAEIVAALFAPRLIAKPGPKICAARSQPFDEIAQAPERDDE